MEKIVSNVQKVQNVQKVWVRKITNNTKHQTPNNFPLWGIEGAT